MFLFGVDVVGSSQRSFSFFSVFVFLSQLALGGCVECVMLSVTRAQPRTVEHVIPRSARAQPRTIFPSDSIISGIR